MGRELRKQGYSTEEARDRAALWNYIALPAMNGTLGGIGDDREQLPRQRCWKRRGMADFSGVRGLYALSIFLRFEASACIGLCFDL